MIMKMGGLVEAAILDAAEALETRDEELADTGARRRQAPSTRWKSRSTTKPRALIALRAPTAGDLRTVLTVMKIAASLERCGDYAKNLAKRTAVLAQMPPVAGAAGVDPAHGAARCEQHAEGRARRLYPAATPNWPSDVRQRDRDVDQMYNALFREFLTHMMEDPRNITACMHLHFIAKNIERVGDHATASPNR